MFFKFKKNRIIWVNCSCNLWYFFKDILFIHFIFYCFGQHGRVFFTKKETCSFRQIWDIWQIDPPPTFKNFNLTHYAIYNWDRREKKPILWWLWFDYCACLPHLIKNTVQSPLSRPLWTPDHNARDVSTVPNSSIFLVVLKYQSFKLKGNWAF